MATNPVQWRVKGRGAKERGRERTETARLDSVHDLFCLEPQPLEERAIHTLNLFLNKYVINVTASSLFAL